MAFLTAQWRDLMMLNWAVPADVLVELVPRGVELDTWQGQTLVSVVGFRFLNTRVRGLMVPLHVNFEEVNLRFYVRRVVDGEVRRGVVFVKEIVPRRCIALVARRRYNENYVAAPMSHHILRQPDQWTIAYAWRMPHATYALSAHGDEVFRELADGSPEAFITEHYWGYCRQRDGSTLEYRVAHPRWRVAGVRSSSLEGDLAALYGPAFAQHLASSPESAFVAEGSQVEVGFGQRF